MSYFEGGVEIVCLEQIIKRLLYTITDEKVTIEKAQISVYCIRTFYKKPPPSPCALCHLFHES